MRFTNEYGSMGGVDRPPFRRTQKEEDSIHSSTISTFIFPRSVMGLTWEETMCVHLLLGHSMFDCWKDSAHDIDTIYKQYV